MTIQPPLIDRDLSILAFNARVLDWAAREEVPLLERLRYLSIVSSNLDEYFEVRMANLLHAAQAHVQEGEFNEKGFLKVSEKAHALVARQYDILRNQLHPAMHAQNIRIVPHVERTPEQRRWVGNYFRREVMPLLLPVSLDPAHPFPQVANKSLNFIVKLGGQDALGRSNSIAIIKVPRALPRLLPLPLALCGGKNLLVSLPSVLRAHLQELFPNRSIEQLSQFRVTRHSDLAVDEDDVGNLLTALREGLQQRHYGKAVRLEVSSDCSDEMAALLCRQFELLPQALYRVRGPVNLARMGMLIDLVNRPELMFPPFHCAYPVALQGEPSMFKRLQQGDVLVHLPFESFDPVLELLRQAVKDPQVVSIQQTIYRTGSDPVLIDLLCQAVRSGKEVTALVELKARFDEEANISWAQRLEDAGAHVVYGVYGYKVHAKMLMVVRREEGFLRRYVHLGTGNYHPRTARLYTDFGLLTCNEDIASDVNDLFVQITGLGRASKLKYLLSSPFTLQPGMVERIAREAGHARAGKPAQIIAKMNALLEPGVIDALYQASQAGVKIQLIVRGVCALRPGVPGLSDNISVRSIVGRFLEHSRIFYFGNDGDEELFIASADWMGRNFFRRIETCVPILDRRIRQRIIKEGLKPYLADNMNAWEMDSDGNYRRRTSRGKPHCAQLDRKSVV